MQKRNPVVVILLSLITFGIYGIYWQVTTAREMRTKGADIPTALLLLVPFGIYYWLYKYSLGVEHISGGKTSGITTFLLWIFTGIGGVILSQLAFNDVVDNGGAVPAYNNGGSPTFQQQAPVAPNPGVASAAATPFAAAPVDAQQPVSEPVTFSPVPATEPTPVVTPTVEAPSIVSPETPVAVAPNPDFIAPAPEVAVQPQVVQPEQPAQPTTFEPQVIAPTVPQEDSNNNLPTPPSQV